MQGKKDDTGKADWDAMPLEVIELLVPVFESGIEVKGYGRHNCIQPFEESRRRFYSGLMRHLRKCQINPLAFNENDKCYHAAQVAFNALMMLYHAKKEAESVGVAVREIYSHEVQLETDQEKRTLPPGMIVNLPDNCCGSLCGRQHVD